MRRYALVVGVSAVSVVRPDGVEMALAEVHETGLLTVRREGPGNDWQDCVRASMAEGVPPGPLQKGGGYPESCTKGAGMIVGSILAGLVKSGVLPGREGESAICVPNEDNIHTATHETFLQCGTCTLPECGPQGPDSPAARPEYEHCAQLCAQHTGPLVWNDPSQKAITLWLRQEVFGETPEASRLPFYWYLEPVLRFAETVERKGPDRTVGPPAEIILDVQGFHKLQNGDADYWYHKSVLEVEVEVCSTAEDPASLRQALTEDFASTFMQPAHLAFLAAHNSCKDTKPKAKHCKDTCKVVSRPAACDPLFDGEEIQALTEIGMGEQILREGKVLNIPSCLEREQTTALEYLKTNMKAGQPLAVAEGKTAKLLQSSFGQRKEFTGAWTPGKYDVVPSFHFGDFFYAVSTTMSQPIIQFEFWEETGNEKVAAITPYGNRETGQMTGKSTWLGGKSISEMTGMSGRALIGMMEKIAPSLYNSMRMMFAGNKVLNPVGEKVNLGHAETEGIAKLMAYCNVGVPADKSQTWNPGCTGSKDENYGRVAWAFRPGPGLLPPQ